MTKSKCAWTLSRFRCIMYLLYYQLWKHGFKNFLPSIWHFSTINVAHFKKLVNTAKLLLIIRKIKLGEVFYECQWSLYEKSRYYVFIQELFAFHKLLQCSAALLLLYYTNMILYTQYLCHKRCWNWLVLYFVIYFYMTTQSSILFDIVVSTSSIINR